jgi:ABC-type transporter Mla subunit MlaD
MAGNKRDDALQEQIDNLQGNANTLLTKLAGVDSNLNALATTVGTMAQTDTAIIQRQQQLGVRFSMEHELFARALKEEMGDKDYQREVNKYMEVLKARQEAAKKKAAAAQPAPTK